MILVDTSVWVAHLRARDDDLIRLLQSGAVCAHPHVIGELALGPLRQREIVLKSLEALPRTTVATDREVMHCIGRHALFGRGVGYVDVCLLAATSLTPNTWLWSFDKKLIAVASDLGVFASSPFPAATLG